VLSDGFGPGWQSSISSTIVSSPAVADGFVVFADRDGYVRALRESDGSPVWSSPIGAEIISSPAVYQGRIYCPATNGKLYCLRLSDGALLWDYTLGGTEISSPNISNGVLFMGSGFPNHRVIALNILVEPPQLLWQAAVEQIVYSSPALTGNRVIIGCDSGRYYAISRTDGSEIWSYNAGGDVLLSSPLVVGNSVYLLPGGSNNKFYRVDMDLTLWPGANWELTLTDPNQPAGTILGTKLATSSPMFIPSIPEGTAGDYAGFVVRFDYALDTNADGLADQYVLNEYAIAINTAARTVKWQIAIGSLSTANQNSIPPFGLCPTPAALRTASGYLVAAASSLSSQLRIVDTSNGSVLMTGALDGPVQASPVVANSRIFVATKNGSVYAFQNSLNHAPESPVAGFSPADDTTIYTTAASTNVTIAWDNAVDAESAASALQYVIRIDDDGEVLESYDSASLITGGATSWTVTLPATEDGIRYTYAIRTLDPSAAYSEWSAPQSFYLTQDITPPEPPANLRTGANNGYVDIYWDDSASPDVSGYLIAYQPAGGSFSAPMFIGNVANYRINGLTNGITYTFRLWTEDYVGWHSLPVDVTATPNYAVFLNGQPYESLAGALTIAQSGQTITLAATTFVLADTLYLKAGVNLTGHSSHLTRLEATNLAAAIQLTGITGGITGTVSNLMIYGAVNGVDSSGYAVTVRNVVIKNCQDAIIGDNLSNIEIVNNTLVYNSNSAVYAAGSSVVRNNIIIGNSWGIYWAGNSFDINKLVISYNNVYGNSQNYVNCTAGTGDVSNSVVFVDEVNNDYREATGSATIDMGNPADDWLSEPHPHGGRINIGAFGNTIYATVSSPLHIATTTLSDGESNAAYSVRISAAGGSPPLTWTVTGGMLPGGLSLDSATGVITGAITLGSIGAHPFTVQVTDSINVTATANFSITVQQVSGNQLRIVTNTLSDGEETALYDVTFSAADGFPPYSWSIIGGALPPNVVLDTSTGQISGTPPAGSANWYSFTIEAVDKDFFSVSKTFMMRINVAKLANIDTGSSGGEVPGSSGGDNSRCFIATAAYGSPLAPSVMVLRQFRDEYLMTNPAGRLFVEQYYRHSPPIAQFIANHAWAKAITRIALVPVIGFSWLMTSMPARPLAGAGLFPALICLVLALSLGYLAIRRVYHCQSKNG
jgi:outer membrane protein assembly factor BamB